MIASDFRRLVTVEIGDLVGINEEEIDWKAVNKRVYTAISSAGLEPKDISDFLGLDTETDTFWRDVRKLPKVKTAVTVANFLGVPAAWLISGKGSPPAIARKDPNSFAVQGINETTESTIIQGNSASTVTINNGVPQMSEQKRELMRIFDILPLRKQTRLLHLAYEMEEDKNKS